ncbi:MAG: LLM class flavin-dependent oxidoreductase, partial [Actinobacteria bacterium]|nr:LLM class flavin-dependent oxidoreductase [Actinomycetota bacterium]
MSPRVKVGVQLHPQHCSVDELREAWEEADRLGVDSIWTWDHFLPLYGDRDGRHYDGWSLLAARAVTTER